MRKNYLLSFVLAVCSTGVFAQSGSQAFTASGLFIVPVGVTTITVELVGAGGDGGGNGGGGGGGGGYASGTYSVIPGDTMFVNIGTGGGGSNAGASNIAALGITAFGGENGTSVSNPNIGGGGAGGNSNGGNIVNYTGGNGGGGYWTYFGGGGGGAAGAAGNGSNGGNTIAWSGQCVTPGGAYGMSGGAPGGDGGKGAGFTDVNCNVSDPAAGGLNYGGGGGGGNGNGGQAMPGANGYALISWGTNGISAAVAVPAVTVLQNPFTSTIVLNHTRGDEQYEVMNTSGKIIWSGKNISAQDFSAIASGLYFVKVSNTNGMQVLKLVKE